MLLLLWLKPENTLPKKCNKSTFCKEKMERNMFLWERRLFCLACVKVLSEFWRWHWLMIKLHWKYKRSGAIITQPVQLCGLILYTLRFVFSSFHSSGKCKEIGFHWISYFSRKSSIPFISFPSYLKESSTHLNNTFLAHSRTNELSKFLLCSASLFIPFPSWFAFLIN